MPMYGCRRFGTFYVCVFVCSNFEVSLWKSAHYIWGIKCFRWKSFTSALLHTHKNNTYLFLTIYVFRIFLWTITQRPSLKILILFYFVGIAESSQCPQELSFTVYLLHTRLGVNRLNLEVTIWGSYRLIFLSKIEACLGLVFARKGCNKIWIYSPCHCRVPAVHQVS